MDLGLSQAGFEIVFANDINPYCGESHKKNFKNTPFYLGTVSDLDSKVLRKISGGTALKGIDLLAAGPPCPSFSKSRFYRKDKPRALDDPVAAETIGGFLNVLDITKPRAFLFENVHGFAYKVHREAFSYVQSEVKAKGYNCSWDVLNLADYGVPQIRKRFFLVGTRKGFFQFPKPSHVKSSESSLFNGNLPQWKTAGDAIADLDTEENADDTGHFAGGKHHDLLRQIPPGDNYLYLTKERGHPDPVFQWRSRYWSFLLKLSPDLPSWTIQARRSNNMGPLHWRNRILRIGEVKRLQSFPDNWFLSGKLERQWSQIGNAVPPLMAYILGKALCKHLSNGKGLSGKKRRITVPGN